MAILINTNTPNILNGVSQQADGLRRPSQGTEQVNAISSLIDGLKKRPPLNNLAKIHDTGTVTASNSFFSLINRDETEKHLIDIQAGVSLASLNITDLVSPASSITLKNEAGTSLSTSDLTYLHTAAPMEDLRSLVVDDYTFIVNRSVDVAMDSSTSTSRNPEAIVFCKAVRDKAVYTIKLWNDETSVAAADYTATYTAAAADDQQVVIAGLAASLSTVGANTTFHWENSNSSTLYIKQDDNSDFRIEISTTYTESFYLFKDSSQSLSLLPEEGYAGFIIRIENDADDTGDEYYVKFVPTNENITTGFTSGYWTETVAPGIEYKLDRTTMPHVIVSEGSNVFTFKPLDWDEMIAGAADTNPQPSFVDNAIRGLLFYQNRLALLTGESVVFSETGNYFNFFRTTVLQQLDSDPIDVALTSSDISLLNYGVVNSEKLIMFSNNAQFAITHGTTSLTPSSIESQQVTKYSNYTDCEPVTLGNSIFFGYDKGDFSGVREYFVGTDTILFDAIDITDQCPRYIEGDIEKLAVVDAENLVIAKQSTSRNLLYGYKFYNQGQQRILSSWFKIDTGLTADAVINDIFTIGNILYTVITRNDGTYIETSDMSSGLKDSDSEIVIALDRRIDESKLLSIAYSPITNLTTLELPYDMYSEAEPVIVTRTTDTSVGEVQLNNVELTGPSTLTVKGDHESSPLWIGQQYTMEYTMTRPTVRQQSESGGSVPIYNGRMTVRYANLAIDNTQYLKVTVQPLHRSMYTYTYTPRLLGTGAIEIGDNLPEKDTVYRVPIYAKNEEFEIKLINDTPFQSNILGVNWEATFQLRSKTI